MLKGFFLTIALFVVGVIALFAVIWLIGTQDIAKALQELDMRILVPVAGLLVVEACISTYRWKYLLNALGQPIPFLKMLPIWLAGNAFNYLSPVVYVGGEGIRIFLLKRRFNIPYYRGSASVFLDQVFNGLSVWPMVVIGFIVFLKAVSSDELSIIFYCLLAITIGIFLVLFLTLVRIFRRKPVIQNLLVRFDLQHGRVGSFLVRMENEMLSLRGVGMKTFWYALILSFMRQGVILLRTMLILFAIGQVIDFEHLLIDIKDSIIISTSVYVSYLIPIPLALGAQEVSQVGVFELIGWSAGAGLLFTTIYRASEMVMVFSGVIILVRAFTAYAFDNLWDLMKVYKEETKRGVQKITKRKPKKEVKKITKKVSTKDKV